MYSGSIPDVASSNFPLNFKGFSATDASSRRAPRCAHQVRPELPFSGDKEQGARSCCLPELRQSEIVCRLMAKLAEGGGRFKKRALKDLPEGLHVAGFEI